MALNLGGNIAGKLLRGTLRGGAGRAASGAMRGISFTANIVTPATPASSFDVDVFRRRFERAFPQAIRELVIPALRNITPHRTGQLRDSWRVEQTVTTDGKSFGVTGRFFWIYLRQADLFRNTVNRTMNQAARVAARRAASGV